MIKQPWWCLGLFVAAAIPTQVQNQNSHVVLPSVEQILDRHEQAVGGREALEKIRSLHEVDIVHVPRTGDTGISEAWIVPKKSYATFHWKQRAEMFKSGFDGETAWSIAPRVGLKKLSGEDLAHARRLTMFPEEIRLRELVSQIRLKGKARVGGREAYILEIEFDAGYLARMYFDSETWLKVREDVVRTDSPGSPIREIYFDDFREIPDLKIKYAFRRVEKSKNTAVEHVKELHFNVPVDESLFKVPSSRIYIQR